MAKSRNMSVAMPRDEYASVSVRKIDNGFIVSKSVSGPKGYHSTETFSATKPKLDIPIAKAPPKSAGAKRPDAQGRAKKALSR